MDLLRPRQHPAGCGRLPRMVDNMRLSEQGRLPLLSRLSPSSPMGIDGYFLRYFGLPFRQFRNGIRVIQDDEGAVKPGIVSHNAWLDKEIKALAKTIGKHLEGDIYLASLS